MLTAAGIVKSYRQGLWPVRRTVPVLTGADIDLFPGEVVGLVGENGSGKSTLMRILVGALGADAGDVTRRGQIGYCPQEPVLYGRLTCDEHFELFGRAYGMSDPAAARSRTAIYDVAGFHAVCTHQSRPALGRNTLQAQPWTGTTAGPRGTPSR